MEAIVLAGGFGTRLRQVVPDVPKPMAPVCGRPFLELLLTALARQGVKRVVLSLGFMAEKISGHFGAAFAGMEIAYVVETSPLGTGGAVRLALHRCEKDHVFVFNGDTFLDLDMAFVERHWQLHGHPIIVGRQVPDAGRYGRLLVEDGRVIGFAEKGEAGAGLVNAGCYVFRRDQLDAWLLGHPFSLESDHLVRAVGLEPVDLVETHGLFIDIGVPADFERAQDVLAKFA